jgi:hypothetical protein
MNEAVRRDQDLTTADIARGNRAVEVESEAEPMGRPAADGPIIVRARGSAPLFSAGEAQELQSRWDSIQTGFVDEPRTSVEEADALVAAAMKRLAEIFAEERSRLEGQWDSGDNISTEDLRLALQRYRSFFTRLLSV